RVQIDRGGYGEAGAKPDASTARRNAGASELEYVVERWFESTNTYTLPTSVVQVPPGQMLPVRSIWVRRAAGEAAFSRSATGSIGSSAAREGCAGVSQSVPSATHSAMS